MKVLNRVLAAAGILLLSVGTASAAGVEPGAFYLSPIVGGYTFDGKQHLDTQPVGGIRAGYNFTKHLGAEALFDYTRTEGTRDIPTTDFYRYGADALLHFFPDNRLVPYIAAGYSGMSLDSKDGTKLTRGIFDYGPGVKFFINDTWALRGDFRHLIFKNEDRSFSNYEYNLGLVYSFGAAKEPAPVAKAEPAPAPAPVPAPAPAPAPAPVVAPPPAPVDSDNDGVIDSLDKCPGTPAGVQVDKDGCPVDSDKDGVPDYLDKCPGTPAGVQVDKDGCPVDSDNDGVPDYLDKCPGTPAGTKVKADGCPEMETLSMSLNIQFATGKNDIQPKYDKEIRKVADYMKKYPTVKGVIEGHTDNVGSAAANMKLSQRRADAVRSYLVKKFGIAPDRLTAKGFGMTRPIADNTTEEGRQQNRRITAVLDSVTVEKQ
ncbi:OmpA family protein [Geotalea sp. SG265]|uniref:OmpA family protein n=1 Tax=Geotalea sp. SG265 TaxID=2922867 RepID=UPI001FAEE153|nr:OmpA family protein [Geotalea sp. SG265]